MDSAATTDRVGERDAYLGFTAMTAIRPGLQNIERNPFGFGSNSWAGAAENAGEAQQLPEPLAVITSMESTEDAVLLRFIGIVESPKTVGRIAVLTDGRAVFQGVKGDTLEGRYRITDISGERVEIEILPAGKKEVLYREGV